MDQGLRGLVAGVLVFVAGCGGESGSGDLASSESSLERRLGDGIVISQVYGGGGNRGAVLNQDFVELFNRADAPVSLTGLSLQYGFWHSDFAVFLDATVGRPIVVLPDVVLAPGRYFLIGLSRGPAGHGAPLPTPDLEAGNVTVAAVRAKFALVRGTEMPLCGGYQPCTEEQVADKVGYGSASDFEGHPAPELATNSAAHRRGGGCVDDGDNLQDFEVAPPAPRNTMSAVKSCP